MSYTNDFERLIGLKRRSSWLNEMSSTAEPWAYALAKHLSADVKMNLKDGYAPTSGVLAQREFSRQYDEVENLGKGVRGDYWQESSGMNRVQCGFRDNRDKSQYEAALDRLEDAIAGRGYKMTRRPSGTLITLNVNLAHQMKSRHGEWLKAMTKAGAVIKEEKLNEDGADEQFAENFAKHRAAEGRPMALSAWSATMKLALERNLEPETTDYTYNLFDLGKVTSALKPFSNLTFTPAREFAPVLFVTGPTETLGLLAKMAEKKLGAYEAKLTSKSRLRIAWE